MTKYENSLKSYRDWYWLGFNDRGEAGYKWTDGTGDDYTNWAAGQPEKTLNFEDCSMIVNQNDPNPQQTGWFSQYCNIQSGVVCKILRGAEPNEDVPTPNIPTPDQQCNSADMSGEGHDWYSFEHKLDDTHTSKKCFTLINDRQLSVQNAENYCNTLGANGGNLISIHHHDDMYKLLQVMRQTRERYCTRH